MDSNLAKKVAQLSNLGWEVKSHTNTTANLGMRAPFGWWWFAFWFILFLGFGAVMYFAWWLATSRKSVFLHVEDGAVSMSGDTHFVEQQELRAEAIMQAKKEIAEKGFIKAMLPAFLAFVVVFAAWFFIIWLVMEIF